MTKKTLRIKGIEESISVSEGMTFQDLACRFQERYGSPIMAAKSGNSLLELCRPIADEKEIELVDLSSLDGIRIYTRGAIFILFMAVRELLGKVSLDVHH
jgi:uridine kinase